MTALYLCIGLQVADGMLTYVGLRAGASEANPLVASAMIALGVGPALVLVKAGGCYALTIVARSPLRWVLWPIAAFYTVAAVIPWLVFLAVRA